MTRTAISPRLATSTFENMRPGILLSREMIPPVRARLLALGAALTAVAAGAGDAAAAGFRTCDPELRIQCAGVRVPLDRSGGVKGSIRLEVDRLRASGSRRGAPILALAGGPGQGAT